MNNKRYNIWTKWLYWFMFAVSIIVVYKTLDNFNEILNSIKNLFSILAPFLTGILMAYLLYMPSKKMENLYQKSKIKFISNKSRKLSVFTVYIIFIILIILIIKFIIPIVLKSLIDLTNNFQEYYNVTVDKFSQLPQDSILKSDIVKDIIEKIKNIDIKQLINIEKITEYIKGALSIASGIFDIFVAIIVSVYILLERTDILKFIKKLIQALFKTKTSRKLGEYFNRTNEIFFKFIASQFLDAIVVSILTSTVMSIMGVKYAILLGIMIGIFNMIPYFGAIIAVMISIIITILTGGISKAIWMAIVVIILQQIDANIINPKIVGNSLKISPLLVIIAVTIGGAYFGVLGMFLAVPVIAVIKILINDFIEYKSRNIKVDYTN